VTRAPFLLLAALTALGLGTGMSRAAGVPSLPSLALRLSDLPPQTARDGSRFWDNAQAAQRDGVPVSLYIQHGRIRSYTDAFARKVMNASAKVWILHADSELTEFRSAANAYWYYRRMIGQMNGGYVLSTNNLGANAGQTGIHVPFRRLQIPVIGSRRAAFSANSGGDEMAFTTRVILFQRGRYVDMLRVRGLEGESPAGRVVAVAEKIDARLKSAR